MNDDTATNALEILEQAVQGINDIEETSTLEEAGGAYQMEVVVAGKRYAICVVEV